MKSPLKILFAAACTAAFLISGCRTEYDADYQKQVTKSFYNGNIADAAKLCKNASDDENGEYSQHALLWHLEAASTAMQNNDLEFAEAALNRAAKLIYYYDRDNNPNFQRPGMSDYVGMRSDRLLLNFLQFLAAFQQNNFEDALIPIRRLRLSQFNYLLNQTEHEFKRYEEENAGKNLPSYLMNELLTQNGNAAGVFRYSGLSEKFRNQPRKELPLLFNPLGFYLSAMGYYFDDNYEEAALDLKYLLMIQGQNELFQRDYVTLLTRIGEKIPDGLANVKPWTHALNDRNVWVIYAYDCPVEWLTQKASFQLPAQVPAYWNFSYIPAQPPKKAPQGSIIIDDGTYQLTEIADLQQILFDEFCQFTLIDMLKSAAARIEAQTAAHAAAIANLAALTAGPDFEGKEFAVAAAIVTVNATKDIRMNDTEWRRWSTIANNYAVAHAPIPADGKIKINIEGKSEEFILKKETTRSIIYVRKIGNKIYSNLWESYE